LIIIPIDSRNDLKTLLKKVDEYGILKRKIRYIDSDLFKPFKDK
jgi:hypothetical protein